MSGLRGFWISLSLCFIMASCVSETLIAVHSDHDCSGGSCPVCLLIQRAENFSRQPKYSVFHPGLSVTALFLAALVLNFAVFRFIPLSSVRLKIKMNL
ncbi:MAG: hypothetical protein LBK62_09040 [Treponema sp.]|jgi:hypothetical protein|nr:hypothetical protein [Treponema sp.]